MTLTDREWKVVRAALLQWVTAQTRPSGLQAGVVRLLNRVP